MIKSINRLKCDNIRRRDESEEIIKTPDFKVAVVLMADFVKRYAIVWKDKNAMLEHFYALFRNLRNIHDGDVLCTKVLLSFCLSICLFVCCYGFACSYVCWSFLLFQVENEWNSNKENCWASSILYMTSSANFHLNVYFMIDRVYLRVY